MKTRTPTLEHYTSTRTISVHMIGFGHAFTTSDKVSVSTASTVTFGLEAMNTAAISTVIIWH